MFKTIKNLLLRQHIPVNVVLTTVVATASFWGFLRLHFMYDDWGVLWLAKNDFHRYWRFVTLWPGGSHPALIISFFPWVYFLGTDPFYYNLFGLVLKIIAALGFGYVLYALTKSKLYFFIGSLVYASSFIGLEAFSIVSTRNIPYVIIFILFSLGLYIDAFNKKSSRHFIFSVLFLLLASLSDPIRVVFFPLIFIAIGVCLVGKKVFKRDFLVKSFILFLATFLGFFASGVVRGTISPFSGAVPDVVKAILTQPERVENLFTTMGNLLSAYFTYGETYTGLAQILISDPAKFALMFLLILFFVSLVYFKIYKGRGAVLLVLLLGMVLTYLPNWFFYYYSVTVYHRYLAISQVFFSTLHSLFTLFNKK